MYVYKTTVSIYKERKFSFESDRFIQEQIDILGENEEYYCLNDDYFTTIKKNGKACGYDVLNKEHIRIEDGSGFLGGAMSKGIFYTLYSNRKKKPSTIRKEIEQAIEKKYGWMIDIDLSIII